MSRSRGDNLVLPASALAEVLVGASRMGPGAVRKTEAFVDAIVDAVHDIDRAVAREAAGLRTRHESLRLPDALVLAAGRVMNAVQILTADQRWSGVDKRVQLL